MIALLFFIFPFIFNEFIIYVHKKNFIYRYFLSKVDQNVIENVNPVNAVRFKIETRLLDCSSGLVQYKQNEELVLSLVVPFRSNNMEIQVMLVFL